MTAEAMTGASTDPLILEMFRRIPPDGKPWPIEKRADWFRAFVAPADLIYGPTSRPIVVALNAARTAGLEEVGR